MTIPSLGATAGAPSRRRRRWWSTCGCSSYPRYHPGWTTVIVINNYFWLSLSLKNNFLKVSIIVIILILFLTVCLMITLPPSCLTWLAGQPGPRLFLDSNALLEIKIPRLAVIVAFCFSTSLQTRFCGIWKLSFRDPQLSGGKSQPCCSRPASGLWIPSRSENMMIVWHSAKYFVPGA